MDIVPFGGTIGQCIATFNPFADPKEQRKGDWQSWLAVVRR
jgi:hypothetical protein